MSLQNKIDTHMHIVPPAYAKWQRNQDGGRDLPAWSRDASLRFMDNQGTQTGIFSITAPGVHFGNDKEARIQARACNEYTAEVVQSDPGRFGFFAILTLPDVEGAIAELDYAYDQLHADGVILLANSRGIYLGDPRFEPLMVALNRRKAVVLIHPGDLTATPVPGIPGPFSSDSLLDTTRAAANLVLSGTLERNPDIKFILAHGGGFVPYAAWRMTIAKVMTTDKLQQAADAALPADVLNPEIDALRHFYYDTALASSPTALPSLLALVGPEHIAFGSDWPFSSETVVTIFRKQLDAYELDEKTAHAIARGTAEQLIPRLAR